MSTIIRELSDKVVSETTEPTMYLRWSTEGVLQQLWSRTFYKDGVAYNREQFWRGIPPEWYAQYAKDIGERFFY